MKDNCHSFSTGRSLASPRAQAAGGGAVLLGAGWGFNFRGICNGWGATLGTWWLWAILGDQRLAPGGGSAVDLFKPSGIWPFQGEQEEPTMARAGQPKSGASPTCREPRGSELRCHCTPVQATRRTDAAGRSGVYGFLPEPLGYKALPQLGPWYY